jgi:hypothetical protein
MPTSREYQTNLPSWLFSSHQSCPTATFQTGLPTDHHDYAFLGSHLAFKHVENILGSSYLQVNNVSDYSPYVGSEKTDTQSPFNTHFKDFGNLAVTNASPETMFTNAAGWQDQSGVASFNLDLTSEMLTHENGVNTVFPPLQGHISNAPPQPSLLVDVYPMMGQVPELAFNWEQGSGQFIKTTPVPVVTNSTRHTIRSFISK